MLGDVHEAAHLIVLSEQVEQGVEHYVDQLVRASYVYVSEVAYRHRELVAAGLGAQPGDHCGREVNAVDADGPRGEG